MLKNKVYQRIFKVCQEGGCAQAAVAVGPGWSCVAYIVAACLAQEDYVTIGTSLSGKKNVVMWHQIFSTRYMSGGG